LAGGVQQKLDEAQARLPPAKGYEDRRNVRFRVIGRAL
jgi:hypothetical protein